MTTKIRTLLVLFTILLFAFVNNVNGEESCDDKLANCEDFNKSSCRVYSHWAKRNCAKFCGICDDKVKQDCPDGWSYFKGDRTCLKVFSEKDVTTMLSWTDSRDSCRRFGGDLVEIRSREKNYLVFNLVGDKTLVNVWIGIFNVGNTTYFDFRYVDGTYLGSFHPWLPNNPDNTAGHEYCVTMHVEMDYSGLWNDYLCGQQLPYVCSIKAN